MNCEIQIAIDPGKQGGVAARRNGTIELYNMPETVHDIAELFRHITDDPFECGVSAVLENVHAMPRDGGVAAFSFGVNFGALQGVLAALRVPYKLVTPQQWQKKVGLLPAGADKKAERKRAIKAFAQRSCPDLKINLKTSDALAMLLVEFEE